MQIDIDAGLCQASGTCVRLAPTVFQLSDDGEIACLRDGALDLVSGVSEAAEPVVDAVKAAESACPTGAIQVDI